VRPDTQNDLQPKDATISASAPVSGTGTGNIFPMDTSLDGQGELAHPVPSHFSSLEIPVPIPTFPHSLLPLRRSPRLRSPSPAPRDG
jgi:hypothetical protein